MDSILRPFPWFVPIDERITFGSSGGITITGSSSASSPNAESFGVEPRVVRDVPTFRQRGDAFGSPLNRVVARFGDRLERQWRRKDETNICGAWHHTPCYLTDESVFESVKKHENRDSTARIHRMECASCDRRGNCLSAYQTRDGTTRAYAASGVLNDDAYFAAYASVAGATLMTSAMCRSERRILQVALGRTSPSEDTVYVRDSRSCAMWTVAYSDNNRSIALSRGQSIRVETSSSLSSVPVHISVNRVVPNEVSILVRDDANRSAIMVWNAATTSTTRHPLVFSTDHTINTPLQCAYAHHPRTLCISHASGLSMIDLRTPQSPCRLLRSTPRELDGYTRTSADMYNSTQSAEQLGPVSTHPTDPFRVITAGRRDVLLVDTRYARVPLLWWAHHSDDAPPEALCVHPHVIDDENASSTLICAASLSLRRADVKKRKDDRDSSCVRQVREGRFAFSASTSRGIYGDRKIACMQYLDGKSMKIPRLFSSCNTSRFMVREPPRPTCHAFDLRTSADASDMWPRDPIAGISLVRKSAHDVRLMWMTRYGVIHETILSSSSTSPASSVSSDASIMSARPRPPIRSESSESARTMVTTKLLRRLTQQDKEKTTTIFRSSVAKLSKERKRYIRDAILRYLRVETRATLSYVVTKVYVDCLQRNAATQSTMMSQNDDYVSGKVLLRLCADIPHLQMGTVRFAMPSPGEDIVISTDLSSSRLTKPWGDCHCHDKKITFVKRTEDMIMKPAEYVALLQSLLCDSPSCIMLHTIWLELNSDGVHGSSEERPSENAILDLEASVVKAEQPEEVPVVVSSQNSRRLRGFDAFLSDAETSWG